MTPSLLRPARSSTATEMLLLVMAVSLALTACGSDDTPAVGGDAALDAAHDTAALDAGGAGDAGDDLSDASSNPSADASPSADAVVDASDTMTPPADSPRGMGNFSIGVTTFSWHDEERDRAVPVEVWYPRGASDEGNVAMYSVDVSPGLSLELFASPAAAIRDASPSAEGPFPLIVFSHGSFGVRIQSVYLTEHLATHGFVVAAPGHVGNRIEDAISGEPDPDVFADMITFRPQDVSFVIDQFEEAATSVTDRFAGVVDTERVGVTGHSFGGYTSLALGGAGLDLDAIRAACADGTLQAGCDLVETFPEDQRFFSMKDDRVDAIAPQTPGFTQLFGSDGLARIDVPLLIEGAGLDQTTPYETQHRPVYDAAGAPRFLLNLETAGHYTYSDVCRIIDIIGPTLGETALGNVTEDGCGERNIAPATGHEIINAATTAFFEVYVAGTGRFATWLRPAAFASDDAVEVLADP